MKPVILLTPQHENGDENVSLRRAYTKAVTNAGGIPLILGLDMPDEDIKDIVFHSGGLLLTGGDDIEPSLYGEARSEKCGKTSFLRDVFEIKAVKYALEADIPTLGICRGIQTMNIALGGSLYQDIPSHSQKLERSKPSHGILITHSPISDIYPRYAQVNSFHHQAVKALGAKLEVFARADDGIIEGIYHKESEFFVGVQWHPEHMTQSDKFAEALFKRFVEKARKGKKK